jgi:hypothetical protein
MSHGAILRPDEIQPFNLQPKQGNPSQKRQMTAQRKTTTKN